MTLEEMEKKLNEIEENYKKEKEKMLKDFEEKLEKLNATNAFNLIYPVGVTYTQYPSGTQMNIFFTRGRIFYAKPPLRCGISD